MRQLIYTIAALLLISLNANAQKTEKLSDMKITGFTGKIENQKLSLQWNLTSSENADYCEVQGSEDGIKYTTIGLVVGEDPNEKGSFRYRHEMKKIRPGLKYFRVLQIEKGEWGYASKSINLIK